MNDDDYGVLLLRPLAGEPAGPGGVDVARAMRAGRRMRRRRLWSGGSLLAAVTATVVTGGVLVVPVMHDPAPKPTLPPDPAVPTACTSARLPMGAHRMVGVFGADPSGRWVIGGYGRDTYTRDGVMIWRDGELILDAAGPEPGAFTLNDVNASGVAVGPNDAYGHPAFAYRDGQFIRLKGGAARAIAINDAGVIVGQLGGTDQGPPVRWASPEAQPERLPMPASATRVVNVRDIAPNGTVAGNIDGDAYLWLPDGTVRKLEPPVAAGSVEPQVFRHGWLYVNVNSATPRVGVEQGQFRYDPRTGTWQNLHAGAMAVAVAAKTPVSTFGDSEPQVFVGPAKLTLPGYQPASKAKLDSYVVEAISDDGRAVAGLAMSGQADLSLPVQPISWRCR